LSGTEYLRSRIRSIQIALDGVKQVIITQQNARIHAGFSLAVVLLGMLFNISRWEWMVLLLVIGLVWTAEIFNTAVEMMTDLISPEDNPLIKTIKDISAGAVMVAAIISILVGLMLFGPRLWDRIINVIHTINN
jgi:diacylglycerol kinase